MILDDQERREFTAFLLTQYGIEMSYNDGMIPILYTIIEAGKEQSLVLKDIKQYVEDNKTSKAVVLANKESAIAYVEAKAAKSKEFLKMVFIFSLLFVSIILTIWFFSSISSKYEYIKQVEKTKLDTLIKK